MNIKTIIACLETIAPKHLQEDYDNSGLMVGDVEQTCTGVLCAMDTTFELIEEAIDKKCNLIITHHPIIFKGIKQIDASSLLGKILIKAIKNDIAIYSIHTNIDNILEGVNKDLADKLNLTDRTVLLPKTNMYKKLCTYVPADYAERVRAALFKAGAGRVGQYEECSFSTTGIGSFKAPEGANPFLGEINKRATVEETKLEIIFPAALESNIIKALTENHPYEEVAYDIVLLDNKWKNIGSGLVGKLPEQSDEKEILERVGAFLNLKLIKHSPFIHKKINKIAICGGAGSFLIPYAIGAGADLLITADCKYHEFSDVYPHLFLMDIGHWESEQCTETLLVEILRKNFPNFAVFKTQGCTNPVHYFIKL